MSGASSVTVKGTTFSLHAESPRMDFGADTAAETRWHAAWKEKVAAALSAFERALSHAEGLPAQRPFDKALPLVRDGKAGQAQARPCKYRLELPAFGLGWIEVALDAPPSEAQAAALRRAVRGVRLND